jgi:hypothetical protein
VVVGCGESVSGFLKFVNLFFAVLNKSLQTCQSIASCAENKETNTIKQFVFSAINGESAKAESRREGDNSRGDDGKCMFHFFLVLLVGGERIVFFGASCQELFCLIFNKFVTVLFKGFDLTIKIDFIFITITGRWMIPQAVSKNRKSIAIDEKPT